MAPGTLGLSGFASGCCCCETQTRTRTGPPSTRASIAMDGSGFCREIQLEFLVRHLTSIRVDFDRCSRAAAPHAAEHKLLQYRGARERPTQHRMILLRRRRMVHAWLKAHGRGLPLSRRHRLRPRQLPACLDAALPPPSTPSKGAAGIPRRSPRRSMSTPH